MWSLRNLWLKDKRFKQGRQISAGQIEQMEMRSNYCWAIASISPYIYKDVPYKCPVRSNIPLDRLASTATAATAILQADYASGPDPHPETVLETA